jgi:prepilin-type N-terminal cleavage/methylation domain-containing protein
MRVSRKTLKVAGFSLIEVLLSVAILATGALAVTSSFVTTKRLQKEAVEITDAGEVANAVLECFRKMPYIVLEEGVPSGDYTLEQLSIVYDAEENGYDLIDSGLMYQLRDRLDSVRSHETITVEQADEAMRISVHVFRDSTDEPIIGTATFVAKNGLNFR